MEAPQSEHTGNDCAGFFAEPLPSRPSPGKVVTSVQPQKEFEWIPHGDSSARKRARAHVTRGFRRAKAVEAQAKKGSPKNDSESPRSRSSSLEEENPIVILKSEALPELQDKVDASASAKEVINGLILQRTIGSGRGDPFATYPVKLTSESQALLDHFFFGVAPVAFTKDRRANFQPVRALSFNIGVSDPSAFHMILSAAANDLAALRGRRDSEDAINHRTTALGLVNKRLSQRKPDSSDQNLSGITLLAGWELLFGSPHDFSTHMQGLQMVLNMRGGIESIRDTNPQLYSIISWFDYAGSCNYVSKRRFSPYVYNPPLLHSDPAGVPEKILEGLPIGFDLYQTLTDTFKGLEMVTSVIRSENTTETEKLTSAAFISETDSALYKTFLAPDQEGPRSRRPYVQQSFYLLVLIYMTLISGYDGPSTELFLYRFEKAMSDKAEDWGNGAAALFRLLLLGRSIYAEDFSLCMSKFVDISVILDWESWRKIKLSLLEFLVRNPACHGELQIMWRDRTEYLVRKNL